MDKCLDHLDFVGQVCPECRLEVNGYGNTEDRFEYCCYPDCGCDGSRLCMAGEPSEHAIQGNVEGMWSGGSKEHIQGRLITYAVSRGLQYKKRVNTKE